MDDNALKIRVDVDTASLRELSTELKRVQTELEGIKADDPRFKEGAANVAALNQRFQQMSDAVMRGKGSLDSINSSTKEAAAVLTPESEAVQVLIAELRREDATTQEVSAAVRQLTQIRREQIGLDQIASGETKAMDDAIVAGKDRVYQANKLVYSSNEQLKASYFSVGNELRINVQQQGGYVSQMQLQRIAEQESTRNKITLAQAIDLVTKAMQAEGATIVTSITELQANRAATEIAAKEQVTFAAALQSVKTHLAANNIEVQQSTGAIQNLGNMFTELQNKVMAAFAVYQGVKFLTDAAEEAARVNLLREELSRLSEQAKERGTQQFNSTKLIAEMDNAAGKTVKQIDLLQISLRAIQLGNIDLNKLPSVMERLDYLTKLTGQDTRETFDLFIRGAETGSAKFQVQFGLLYDVKKAQDEYADSIGKTADQLDDEQKKYANVNAAIEALSKRQVDNNSESVKSLENMERMKVAFDDAKIAIGTLIASPIGKFLASIAIESAVAAEGIVAIIRALYGVAQFNLGNFKGAMTTFREVGKIGETIISQTKEMGNIWTEAEKERQKSVDDSIKQETERSKSTLAVIEEAKKNAKNLPEKERAIELQRLHGEELVEGRKHAEELRKIQIAGNLPSPVDTENGKERKASEKSVADFLKETEKVLQDEELQTITDGTQKKLVEEKRFHENRVKELSDELAELPEIEAKIQTALAAEKKKEKPNTETIKDLEKQLSETLALRKRIHDAQIAEEERSKANSNQIGQDWAREQIQIAISKANAEAKVSGDAQLTEKAKLKVVFQNRIDDWNALLKLEPQKAEEVNAAKLQAEIDYQEALKEIKTRYTGGGVQSVNQMKKEDLPDSLAKDNQIENDIEHANQMIGKFKETLTGKMGFEALSSGFDAVGNSIQQSLINKLPQANSIFQQFVFGVLQGLAQIATKLASMAIFSGILSLITGGSFTAIFGGMSGIKLAEGGVVDEPVIGVGSHSGKRYEIGEAGAEVVTPIEKHKEMMSSRFTPSINAIKRLMEIPISVGGSQSVNLRDFFVANNNEQRREPSVRGEFEYPDGHVPDIAQGNPQRKFDLQNIINRQENNSQSRESIINQLGSLSRSVSIEPIMIEVSGETSIGDDHLMSSWKRRRIIERKIGSDF